MTFKHKLARRLAISRELSMVSMLLWLAACTDETMGPETSQPSLTEAAAIVPSTVTIQTNQQLRFQGQTIGGKVVSASYYTWHASGGTMSADGVFSASAPGTYKIVGRGRGRQKADTSTVIVVTPPADVVGIQVSPGSASLLVGSSQTFSASALLSDGSSTAVGVTWTATGGTIDAGGTYKAGTTAGSFKVVATWSSGTLADTAVVTLTAPTLTDLVIKPASYSMSTGTTKQFTAYGHNSLGDSVAVQATFSATGGTISSSGLYTAGSTAGSYRVIAAAGGLADTAAVTLTTPTLTDIIIKPASYTMSTGTTKQYTAYGHNSLGDSVAVQVAFSATGGNISTSGLYTAGSTAGTYHVIAAASGLADTAVVTLTTATGQRGTPYGPIGLWSDATSVKSGPSPFSGSKNFTDPSSLVTQISAARLMGQKLILTMTGGPHRDYVTNSAFDFTKWKARMDQYNTSTIRNAVAQAVSDGTVIGNSMIDEPEHSSWGGVVTKSLLDQMAAYGKQYFPTLPMGFNTGPTGYRWRSTERFQRVDFVQYQFNWNNPAGQGDVVAWRTAVLNQAALDHVTPGFSLNILDGGVQDKDGTWDCTSAGQAGKGTYSPNCRMTATQVRDWGLALVAWGCVMQMWQYDGTYISRTDNQASFKALADSAARLPRKACVRA